VKVLLDVCTPLQVRQALPDHEIRTVVKMGWGDFENGRLLQAAESSGFDLFIICDKNLRDQQNLAGRRLAILELWTNHRPTLERHFALIRQNADTMRRVNIAPFPNPADLCLR
jgi:hypothetical protein